MSQDEIKDIETKLHKIDLQLQRVMSMVESENGNITRLNNEMTKKISLHQSVLFGNGTAGLTEKVRNMEEILNIELKKKNDIFRWFIGVLTTISTGTLLMIAKRMIF